MFAKNTKKGMLVGRNFDWFQKGGTIHFIPPKRVYGSMSHGICLIEQLGADRPFDGINDKGLFIGIAGLPDDISRISKRSNSKLKINDLGIVKYVLERASSVREALSIFKCFKIEHSFFELSERTHYLIADSNGYVTSYSEKGNEQPQRFPFGKGYAMTNFPRSVKIVNCWRYNTVLNQFDTVKGIKSAMKLLEKVKQDHTAWSGVFNLSKLGLDLCIDQEYDAIYSYNIKENLKAGETQLGFGYIRRIMNPKMWKVTPHPYKTAKQLTARNNK